AHVLAERTFGGHRDRHGYSTTLGTRKKWSCAAGAFATTSSAISPSVTSSGRFFNVMATTRVIGSTAWVSTSSSSLIHSKMPDSSCSNAFASASLTLVPARRAIRRTVASSTSIAGPALHFRHPDCANLITALKAGGKEASGPGAEDTRNGRPQACCPARAGRAARQGARCAGPAHAP